MESSAIIRLLNEIRDGTVTVEEGFAVLRDLPFQDISVARIDHHREMRTDIPEVVFAKNKRTEDVVRIAEALREKSGRFLITRASAEIHEALKCEGAVFYPASGIIAYGGKESAKGNVLIISAGTADIPVAEEAGVTASFLGSRTEYLYDVGVAGIHRLFSRRKLLDEARVIVIVAGMEGALPSVVGGVTSTPIIAVPASTGYGTSFGGLTALFAMLNSCVPGIAVMNIDNGFGAGCFAHKINSIGIS